MKQTLTPEQMRQLKELGLNTSNASICWLSYNGINTVLPRNFHLPTSDKDYEICDAYTLADIIEMLPSTVNTGGDEYWLEFGKSNLPVEIDTYYAGYISLCDRRLVYYGSSKDHELIDVAYKMLCWCLENKYIETKEE